MKLFNAIAAAAVIGASLITATPAESSESLILLGGEKAFMARCNDGDASKYYANLRQWSKIPGNPHPVKTMDYGECSYNLISARDGQWGSATALTGPVADRILADGFHQLYNSKYLAPQRVKCNSPGSVELFDFTKFCIQK